MSFLDTLRTASASPGAQVNTFLLEYKPTGRRVFVFLEGREDPCFYRRFIEDRLPAGYALRMIKCGNKDGVLDAISDFMSRHLPNPRVVAFVDKDHSDLVAGARQISYAFLHQTEFYSVENYVCEPQVLERFCIESLGLDDGGAECNLIREQYIRSRARFYEAMGWCMAWIVAARRRGGTVNLGNLDTGKFVELDDDLMPVERLSDDERCDYLERTTGGSGRAPPIAAADVESILNELRAIHPKRWLRGKQELWHAAAFLRRLAPTLKSRGQRAGGQVAVSPSNALEVLAPRTDAPPGLAGFLEGAFAQLPATP